MDYLASGTGSVIHNGSYFYHRHGSNVLVRYDLETTEQIQSDEIGEIASVDCARRHDHTFEVEILATVLPMQWNLNYLLLRAATKRSATHGCTTVRTTTWTTRWTKTDFG